MLIVLTKSKVSGLITSAIPKYYICIIDFACQKPVLYIINYNVKHHHHHEKTISINACRICTVQRL